MCIENTFEIKTENNCRNTVILDSSPVKDEIDSCPNSNSSRLDIIKEEITTYQNTNDNKKLFHNEEYVKLTYFYLLFKLLN